MTWAQQAQSTAPTGNKAPALATAQPATQATASPSALQSAKSSGESEDAATNDAATNANTEAPLLRLGPGDLLDVSVYNVPELTSKVRIGTSGEIYLPLIDYIHVADLTVDEAQNLVEKRLQDGGFVRNPHVTIFLDESASQGVTIIGEVVRPGIYPALGNRRLYDLISAAGGFSQSAGRNISVIRKQSTKPITVNLPRNLADDVQDNIDILPGDTITVPKAPVVYVVGDVGHPAGLLIDNGHLTVLQALALAGGPNRTAKLGAVSIIRKGPTGMVQTRIPLKKMLRAEAPDMNLQADDILFVPLSGIRSAAVTGVDAAISATAGLAVIAAH
jgi:polysaccharide biosynthesis/export protein